MEHGGAKGDDDIFHVGLLNSIAEGLNGKAAVIDAGHLTVTQIDQDLHIGRILHDDTGRTAQSDKDITGHIVILQVGSHAILGIVAVLFTAQPDYLAQLVIPQNHGVNGFELVGHVFHRLGLQHVAAGLAGAHNRGNIEHTVNKLLHGSREIQLNPKGVAIENIGKIQILEGRGILDAFQLFGIHQSVHKALGNGLAADLPAKLTAGKAGGIACGENQFLTHADRNLDLVGQLHAAVRRNIQSPGDTAILDGTAAGDGAGYDLAANGGGIRQHKAFIRIGAVVGNNVGDGNLLTDLHAGVTKGAALTAQFQQGPLQTDLGSFRHLIEIYDVDGTHNGGMLNIVRFIHAPFAGEEIVHGGRLNAAIEVLVAQSRIGCFAAHVDDVLLAVALVITKVQHGVAVGVIGIAAGAVDIAGAQQLTGLLFELGRILQTVAAQLQDHVSIPDALKEVIGPDIGRAGGAGNLMVEGVEIDGVDPVGTVTVKDIIRSRLFRCVTGVHFGFAQGLAVTDGEGLVIIVHTQALPQEGKRRLHDGAFHQGDLLGGVLHRGGRNHDHRQERCQDQHKGKQSFHTGTSKKS